MNYIEELSVKSKNAFTTLKNADTNTKNNALKKIAASLVEHTAAILQENQLDLAAADKTGVTRAMRDRLELTEQRIAGIAEGVLQVADLQDPVGQIIRGNNLKNGLKVVQVREPLGVIAMIFEARPNVIVDAASLAIKSGNTCILRGGKEAANSNIILANIIREAIKEDIPMDSVQLVEKSSHSHVDEILQARGFIDLVIPRGSKRLIDQVVREARIPVIETGAGICHIYVASSADFDMATRVIVNAKAQRPSVCNAVENVLIDEKIAADYAPLLKTALEAVHVEFRGDERIQQLTDCIPAVPEDFHTEYLDYILSVAAVNGLDEAIDFINGHSSHHSEAIITKDINEADQFSKRIDSACVFVNTSTRFADGGEFGYGAEIGISTQKIHARGPVGLSELTTTKYLVTGNGQIRK